MNRIFRNIRALVLLVVCFSVTAASASAQTIVRDAEIENLIRSYVAPIFKAAGLNPRNQRIYMIQDDRLNAFVIPGGDMFINTGLLIRTEDPLQLIGVMAHETGHIAGGHYIGRERELANAQITALAATLLGIGAAVLSGQGGAAVAGASLGQQAGMSSLLSYSRSQEAAADQAGVSYLQRAQLSPKGLLEFMEILQNEEVLIAAPNQDPYLMTHPLTRERVAFLEQAVAQSPYNNKPIPPEMLAEHARMRAKLIGYLKPQIVPQVYPASDTGLPARYARAIAAYRLGHIDDSLQQFDALLRDYPRDAYMHELKAQILLENGRVAEAADSYGKAVELRPDEPLLHLSLAQALVEQNTPATDRASLPHTDFVLAREPDSGFAWRLKAIAEGRLGDKGEAALALAEMNYANGDPEEAQRQAKRALALLPAGSASALRAADLEAVAGREADDRAKERGRR